MNAKYGNRSGAHNLQAGRPHDYSRLHATLEGTVMTQHSMKQGIKIFGEAVINAVLKELKQLHDRQVLEPANSRMISRDEKREALQYLMFLKTKRCRKIKGRGRGWTTSMRQHVQEGHTHPTVATKALILSCLIDAIKKRDVVTCNIPGAFMQLDTDGDVVMKLEGVIGRGHSKNRSIKI